MLEQERVRFTAFDEWSAWIQTNRWIFDAKRIASIVERVQRNGLIDPVYGWIPAPEVRVVGSNYRETIVARQANARVRAELDLIVDIALEKGWEIDVYAPESITPFAGRLRKTFPRFIGSEYLPDPGSRAKLDARHRDILHQDVQALSFATNSFDLYISNEIFEHVPSIEETLGEALRVLKPGGTLISTFPFRFMHEISLEKARMVDSKINYLTDPEYHGNPVGNGVGSLVFTIPAWDILKQSRKVGFAAAHMYFVSSARLGVTGADLAGIFVLAARK